MGGRRSGGGISSDDANDERTSKTKKPTVLRDNILAGITVAFSLLSKAIACSADVFTDDTGVLRPKDGVTTSSEIDDSDYSASIKYLANRGLMRFLKKMPLDVDGLHSFLTKENKVRINNSNYKNEKLRKRLEKLQGRVSGVGVKREILTKLQVQQRVVVADRINIRRRRHTTILLDLLLHLVTMTPILLRPVMFQPAAAVRVVVRGEKRNRERSGKKQWLPFKPQKVNCKLS
jgi:hypothetical protein